MGPLNWLGLIVLGVAMHWTINLSFTSNPAFRSKMTDSGTKSLLRYGLYVVSWLLILIGVAWSVTVMSFGWGVLSLSVLGMVVHNHRQRRSPVPSLAVGNRHGERHPDPSHGPRVRAGAMR